jgi:hypothetical protein
MCRRSSRIVPLTRALFVLLPGVVLGCGGDGSHRVSGTVTFAGAPVPAGKVYFLPDGTKGNQGPTGFADIKDGKYDTTTGRGAVAGPVIIAVEGIDPSSKPAKADPSGEITAKVLFPRYEITADLPTADSTKDILVPAEAAKGPSRPQGSPAVVP